MNGKGDKRRPMSVQYDLFENNWDRIFGKKEEPLTLREVMYDGEKVGTFDATNLREVAHDGLWKHSCTVEMAVVYIGKNETCDYCGAWEEDGQ
jgi:hypothetical protein